MHKVWLADDDEAIRIVLEESLRDAGFDIRTFETATDLIENLANEKPDLILTDVQMPGMHGYDLLKHINNNFSDLPVIIMTAFADMQAAIDSYGSGAFEYIPKPFDLNETIQIIRRALEKKPSTKGLKSAPKTDIIGKAQSMQIVFRAIGKLSNTNATVLVQGESGTGKELIAKSLHKNSPRHDMPFIALNMADIPKELVESELFGHEKGAFTGAIDQKKGKFEIAKGGTLFLDEIGEMSFHLQAKLLRILQERNVTRLGGQKPIDLDIRIVAATNRNLKTAIIERSFREDLYFRLSAFKITIPALKQRPLDILPLAEQFITQQGMSGSRISLSDDAQKSLIEYHWPGNVRELQNVVMRALVLTQQNVIDSSHLVFDDITISDQQENFDVGQPGKSAPNLDELDMVSTARTVSEPLSKAIKSREYQAIMAALQNSRNREQAAEVLGISARTLRHKLQRLREQGMAVTRAYAR